MPRRDFTIWLILSGFYFKELTRSLLLPNLIVISHFFFGTSTFEAVEIGLLITMQLGASAVACLLFGILADRKSRKMIAIISLIIWLIGIILIIFTLHYLQLLIGELLVGVGFGGYTPVAQAIIGDATPSERKGRIYGWSSILMLLGFFSGLMLASVFSPNWQLPFLIAGLPLCILIVLYSIQGTQFKLGMHDDKLKAILTSDNDLTYDYCLTRDAFKKILQNKTNLLIFIEGIFSILGISIITTYFFPYLEESAAHVTPLVISLITLLIITPVNIAGIIFWGWIGDRFEKKYPRIRVLLIALSFTIATPLFIFAFWIQGTPASETSTLLAAFSNPGVMLFVLIFAIGYFIAVIYDPNQPPIINAINLPETRGSVFALNRFVEEVGGALGPLVVGIIFESMGQNFSIAMTLGMLFMIPGIFCWWMALKTYPSDHNTIESILEKRARLINKQKMKLTEK
ncbi:MAG: MFS transporter [Candidatus Helarchaeota archaeon]